MDTKTNKEETFILITKFLDEATRFFVVRILKLCDRKKIYKRFFLAQFHGLQITKLVIFLINYIVLLLLRVFLLVVAADKTNGLPWSQP